MPESPPHEIPLAEQLERLWEQGRRPDVAGFLRAAGDMSAAVVAAALAVDQWHRWHAGERVPAEDYLRQFPALATDAEAALEVIYGELLVRETLGEAPDTADYLRRFPQVADRLCQQLALHQAMADTATRPAGTAGSVGGHTPAYPPLARRATPLPQVAGYEVLAEIGRGGMGVVYKARDLSLDRVVALKMIIAGEHAAPEHLARFRGEAEAIARLHHPNVVQIHQVGQRGGLPYFAMEYVSGGTLERRLAGAPQPPGAAAALIEQLAGAVHAAHRCGVIHRDLKPANVLLTPDGTPKVADFGLAKRLGGGASPTTTGAILGTPSYMAPEQALGKATVAGPAVDIYSLGAILYEALTGRPPFLGATAHDTLMQVVGEEPVAPRRLNPAVPLDLETVCLKCLHKQPERRYASAEALGEELARFRRGEPILARPVGTLARLARWCRRNPAVAGLSAAVAAALLVGTAVAWLFALEADRRAAQEVLARRHADEQATLAQQQARLALARQKEAWDEGAIARAVNDFLQKDLLLQAASVEQADRGFAQNPNLTVKEALDRAAARIGKRFPDQPLVEAALRQTIGAAYRGVGEAERGTPHLRKALMLRKRELGPDHPDTLDSMSQLANSYIQVGKLSEALTLFKEAFARSRAKRGADDPKTIGYMISLGVAYHRARGVRESLPFMEETVGRAKAALGPNHVNTLLSMHNLGLAQATAGRTADAQRLLEDVVKRAKAALGDDHPETLSSMNTLATLWASAGRFADAEKLLQEAIDAAKAKLAPDHPDTLISLNNLGGIRAAMNRLDEAVPLLENVLARARAKLGADNPGLLVYTGTLVHAYAKSRRLPDALRLQQEAVDLARARLGPGHPMTLHAVHELADLAWDAGKTAEPLALLQETFAVSTRRHGPADPDTVRTAVRLARAYRDAGRLSKAVSMAAEAVPLCRKHLPPDDPALLVGLSTLASALDLQRDYVRAEPLYREVLDISRKRFAADDPRLGTALANLGFTLMREDKYVAAEPLLRECVAFWGKRDPRTQIGFATTALLGGALLGQKKYAEAEPLLLAGYEGMKKQAGAIHPGQRIHLVQTAERLVRLYEALGRPAEARRWRGKLDQERQESPAAATAPGF